MAIKIPNADSLKLLFADFVQNKLNLPANKVLISNLHQGQPSFKINEQVAFVDLQFEPDFVNTYKNRVETNNADGTITITQSAMRTIMLSVIFYGPGCDALASALVDIMYQDSSKQFLSQNEMHFIPDKTQVVGPIFENFNGQHWDRADVKLYLYGPTEISETVEIIQSLDITTKFDNMEV